MFILAAIGNLSVFMILVALAMICGEIASTTLSRITIPVLYYMVQA
jgi:multidrug efflux pump subunit AcrB